MATQKAAGRKRTEAAPKTDNAGRGTGKNAVKAATATPKTPAKLPQRADLGIGDIATSKRRTRGADSRPRPGK